MVYFLYPETGYRSLEEVDVIFHAASLGPNPWLNVRKIAANEPLWYGKDGEEPFNYEDSEWHQRHVRFSDEIKSSGELSNTLNGSSNGHSPTDFGKEGTSGSDEESEKPRDNGDFAAPSPVISRTSRERASRERNTRSAGRA